MKIKKISEYLNNKYPIINAEDFDQPSIGFAVGSEEIEVKNVLLSLDLTCEVVEEAILKNCNLIITHHPFLFRPINKIILNSMQGKIISLLCKNDISVYSMHTNLDVGEGGVNDTLALMLGIKEVKIFNEVASKGNYLRYGEIEEVTLLNLTEKIKNIFNLKSVRVLGDLNKKVSKIGIVGGSGAHVQDLHVAKSVDLDCYITGEVSLSANLLSQFLDLNLIEISHGVEKFVFNSLKKELTSKFDTEFIISEILSDKMISI